MMLVSVGTLELLGVVPANVSFQRFQLHAAIYIMARRGNGAR